ncbi:MAG: ATP-dependent Clp protease adaptor ClpS [Thermoleophilia bacterium]|nr:ATP-dependent Clp protease adaptor ClpS [Thermoleophilia bacterium]
MATETPVRPSPADTDDLAGYGEAIHVTVLNDNHNTFEHVAQSLAKYLPGVDYERGMALANQIHSSGSARVWSGAKEQAELYWQQLNDAGLTMAPLG